MAKKVLSVGQCGYDNSQLGALLKTLGAEIVVVARHAEVAKAVAAHSPKLILVNRVNDSDSSSGLDFIKELKLSPDTSAVPVMLVSNYPDAQKEAEKLGAASGFGKSQLGQRETADLLRKFLE